MRFSGFPGSLGNGTLPFGEHPSGLLGSLAYFPFFPFFPCLPFFVTRARCLLVSFGTCSGAEWRGWAWVARVLFFGFFGLLASSPRHFFEPRLRRDFGPSKTFVGGADGEISFRDVSGRVANVKSVRARG